MHSIPMNALESNGSRLIRYLREESTWTDTSTEIRSTLNLIVLGHEREFLPRFSRPHS